MKNSWKTGKQIHRLLANDKARRPIKGFKTVYKWTQGGRIEPPGRKLVILNSSVLISPQDSSLSRHFTKFLATAGYDSSKILDLIQSTLRLSEEKKSQIPSSVLFLFSLIDDLFHWGCHFEVVESKFWVTIPSLDSKSVSPEIVTRIRNAMMRLRGDVTAYVPKIDSQQAIELVKTGTFQVLSAAESEMAAEDFRSGIQTWSMPYRTREGRTSRFVGYFSSGNNQIPAGLLEIGDDAPHNPSRDRYMGFTESQWEVTQDFGSKLASRLYSFRCSLIPEGLPANFTYDAEQLADSVEALFLQGKGRTGNHEEISLAKRRTYLARLISAELACSSSSLLEISRGVTEGLRVIRDLTLPRVNAEMTICGALPPFGPFLVGKLMASMAAHPTVRSFVDREFGLITSSIFDTKKLAGLIPNSGLLFITTKGLYPGHSSQYNNVLFPTVDGKSAKLKKLGDTVGVTASHLSDATMKYAVAFRNDSKFDSTISKLYGSGGAKRQRFLTEAIRELGLPVELVHANISRPVYGFSFVANLKDVLVFNSQPDWIVRPYGECPTNQVEEEIVELWRHRWLDKIVNSAGGAFGNGTAV